jgi:hypothetical protein
MYRGRVFKKINGRWDWVIFDVRNDQIKRSGWARSWEGAIRGVRAHRREMESQLWTSGEFNDS